MDELSRRNTVISKKILNEIDDIFRYDLLFPQTFPFVCVFIWGCHVKHFHE